MKKTYYDLELHEHDGSRSMKEVISEDALRDITPEALKTVLMDMLDKINKLNNIN